MKNYSKQNFDDYLGQKFSASAAGANIEFTLQKVVEEKNSQPHPQNRQPFSLFFTTPVTNQVTQGMYQLEHHAFDDLTIFMVPVEQSGAGEDALICYQAIFN